MSDLFLSGDNFGDKIYSRFPPAYREADLSVRLALYRYLQGLSDGGFKYAIEEINGIANLVDPATTRLDALEYLLNQYGFESTTGVPEQFLRFLAPVLAEAYSKKGSIAVVRWVTEIISGVKVSTEIAYGDDGEPYLIVSLDLNHAYFPALPDSRILSKVLVDFTPFYLRKNLVYKYRYLSGSNLSIAGAVRHIRQVVPIGKRFSDIKTLNAIYDVSTPIWIPHTEHTAYLTDSYFGNKLSQIWDSYDDHVNVCPHCEIGDEDENWIVKEDGYIHLKE